jgi:hypothetical protein
MNGLKCNAWTDCTVTKTNFPPLGWHDSLGVKVLPVYKIANVVSLLTPNTEKILYCFANLSFEILICWIVTHRNSKTNDGYFCGNNHYRILVEVSVAWQCIPSGYWCFAFHDLFELQALIFQWWYGLRRFWVSLWWICAFCEESNFVSKYVKAVLLLVLILLTLCPSGETVSCLFLWATEQFIANTDCCFRIH